MNAVVLGGNGFIGSHLVDKLKAGGHSVRIFDKHPEPFRGFQQGVDYRWGSFGDKWDLDGLLDGIDVVFHLVSTTLPKTSNDDPAFDISSNLIPTLGLLEECVRKKVKKVVFTSSGGTVYGDPAQLPVKEEHVTHPLCSYGVTKLSIENYLLYFKHQFGLDCTIVRPSNAYGPRQNPLGIQGAIPVFLAKLKKGQPIELWGDGSVVRDYVYVEDLAEGLYRCGLSQTQSSIFNLGSGQGVSMKELVGRIQAVTGLKGEVRQLPPRIFDVHEIYLDISRAKAELDWAPSTSLDQGLKMTWEFVKGLPT